MKHLNIVRHDSTHTWLNQEECVCFQWAAWLPWQPKMLCGICTVLWVLFFFLFCFMCISPLMKYNWDVSRSNKQRHGEPLQPRVLLLPHFYFYPSPFSTFPLTFWLSPHNKGLGSPHIKMGQSSTISVISNFRWRRKGRLVSWQVRQLHLYLSACLHIKKQTYGEIII